MAGRVAGERLSGSGQAGAASGAATRGPARAPASKRLARGVGGFLRPFARVGGIVWLEVTGVFFLLFVFVFIRAMWQMRTSAMHGPDHWKFVASGGMALVFLYLSVSSFWRARKK